MRTPRALLPFVDVLLGILMVFVTITVLLSVKVAKENTESYQQLNVLYLVTLNWSGNSDLDLWARDPGGKIVSFHRREGGKGSLFSLNRDCLGAGSTEIGENGVVLSKINEEIISIRGTFTGEYIVNVHAYNMKGVHDTTATVKLFQNSPYKELKAVVKVFTSTGAEETFFRFTVDNKGQVLEFSDMPVSLTTQQQTDQ